MSLLDRIRSSRQKSVLPGEVKQYYQSETRQRRGVAIVLAVAALLVTIAVAAGLFFGGRFIYNKLTGDDKGKKPATTQNGDKDWSAGDNNSQGQNGMPGNNQGQQPAPGQKPAPAPAPPTPAQTPPARANPTTPALGDNPLPHTGDEGM